MCLGEFSPARAWPGSRAGLSAPGRRGVSKPSPAPCAAYSLCWHRLLPAPAEDRQEETTKQSLWARGSHFLRSTVSHQSCSLVSAACLSYARLGAALLIYHASKNLYLSLQLLTVAKQSQFFSSLLFYGLEICEVSNRVKRNTLLTSCRNPLQKANFSYSIHCRSCSNSAQPTFSIVQDHQPFKITSDRGGQFIQALWNPYRTEKYWLSPSQKKS